MAACGVLWVVGLGSAAACEIDVEESAPVFEGKVQIGTGATAWEPLLPDHELRVQLERSPCLGPGGRAIVHARIAGMAPGDPALPGSVDNPTTTFAAFREGGARLDPEVPPYRLGYAPSEGRFHELASGRLLVLSYDDAIEIDGQPMLVRVEVVDADGRFAADERWVVARVEE